MPTTIDSRTINSHQHNIAATLGIKSNFSKYLEFDLYTTTGVSINMRRTAPSDRTTVPSEQFMGKSDRTLYQNLNLSIKAHILNERLAVEAYSGINLTKNPTLPGERQLTNLLNGSIGYTFLAERNATISITAYDILNSSSIYHTTSTAQSLNREWSYSSGRYITLTLSYKFNHKK